MKPNKIVFAAHDFSPSSRNSLEVAAAIAQKTGSKLFIYHVVSSSVLADSETVYTYSPDLDIKKASALMRRGITYLKKKFTGVPVAFEVDYGFLVPMMTSKIEELNPWLTVLGVKKRTGMDKVIFGDTCTTLIGKVKSPMLVIPLNYKALKLNSVVYGWDGKSAEVHQLNVLRDMMGEDHTNLTALNVSHYDDTVDKNAAAFRFALKKMFPNQHTDLKQVMGLDKEVEFEKAVKKMKPDVLVVYAHHYSVWQNIFHKRFSRYALKFSQSPVLVVA